MVVQLILYATELSRFKLWFNEFTRANYRKALAKQEGKGSSSLGGSQETESAMVAVGDGEKATYRHHASCSASGDGKKASDAGSGSSSLVDCQSQQKPKRSIKRKTGNGGGAADLDLDVLETSGGRATADAKHDIAGNIAKLTQQVGKLVRRAPT